MNDSATDGGDLGGRPFVSVVLPVYNEATILETNLRLLVDYMTALEGKYRWEVLLIDDGSTDGTGEIVDRLASAIPHVRSFHHPANFNIGQALRYGFGNSRGDYVVTYDIDLSYSLDHIERLLDEISASRAKVVVASPYMKGGRVSGVPWHRKLLSRTANWFLSLTAKSGISTVTGMVRAYDRRFIQRLDLKAMDNEINSEIIYKAELLRARIREIPAQLSWTRDPDTKRQGSIRIRRMTEGFAFSGFIFRPFMFFVVPGLVIGFLALYALGWVVYHVIRFYGQTTGGLDPRISAAIKLAWLHSPHAFIVGGIALVVAIQLVTLGILSAQSKRYFEELFHLGSSILSRLPSDRSNDKQ